MQSVVPRVESRYRDYVAELDRKEAVALLEFYRKNAKAEDLKGLEDLKAKGMEVYVVPENEIKNWQAATKPVWDIFTKHAGEQGKKILDLCTK